ncbi:MAG TPA: response regulator [Sedimentisphaerales bacterium]|nr:response regulator [Sedimentisphaerales bacterium]
MRKILFADDEMDVRLMFEKRFTFEGYSVITAYNGNQALSLAKSECPDVIVLDMVLGDKTGEEVALKLKEDPKTRDIPVIFLSALFSKEDEVLKCDNLNGICVFAKPYDAEELLSRIEGLLDKKVSAAGKP